MSTMTADVAKKDDDDDESGLNNSKHGLLKITVIMIVIPIQAFVMSPLLIAGGIK